MVKVKKNKLWLMLIYFVVGILLISVIMCAAIKVNYKPEIAEPTIINIVANGGVKPGATGSKENNKDVYNTLMEKINNSFNESVLASVFSGRSGFKSIIADSNKTNPMDDFTGFKVELSFAGEQTIMQNGEAYRPNYNSTKTIKYTMIYFDVTEEKGMQQHTIFYKTFNSASNKVEYVQQSVMCNFEDFYEYLDKEINQSK